MHVYVSWITVPSASPLGSIRCGLATQSSLRAVYRAAGVLTVLSALDEAASDDPGQNAQARTAPFLLLSGQ